MVALGCGANRHAEGCRWAPACPFVTPAGWACRVAACNVPLQRELQQNSSTNKQHDDTSARKNNTRKEEIRWYANPKHHEPQPSPSRPSSPVARPPPPKPRQTLPSAPPVCPSAHRLPMLPGPATPATVPVVPTVPTPRASPLPRAAAAAAAALRAAAQLFSAAASSTTTAAVVVSCSRRRRMGGVSFERGRGHRARHRHGDWQAGGPCPQQTLAAASPSTARPHPPPRRACSPSPPADYGGTWAHMTRPLRPDRYRQPTLAVNLAGSAGRRGRARSCPRAGTPSGPLRRAKSLKAKAAPRAER